MSGAIMPLPLMTPASVTVLSPITARVIAALGKVSVVPMASVVDRLANRPAAAPVAQRIEHPPPKRGAAGSIPAGRTTFMGLSIDHGLELSRRSV